MQTLSSDDAQNLNIEQVMDRLDTGAQGLGSAEAAKRLEQVGPNALAEKKRNPVLDFLRYFWGPIPWMIEAAAVLSAIVRHWEDFIVIVILLLFNACIGFWQESKAQSALEALKNQLALQARVLRDGQWGDIPAADLVPGDIVLLRLGDIIPADAKIISGEYLSVDQAALTGESLPVSKKVGDAAYSGSVAKQGEVRAVVTATGGNTFFGRTAALVESAGAPSHFQKAVLTIGDYLIYLTLGLVAMLILFGLERGLPFLELVQFALILTVAAIPVAMPAVLSVTMAVGALALSKMKAIVSRLEAIEEMAGMDVLCSDKTGTLTQNKLTLGDVQAMAGAGREELLLAAALASKAESADAIDSAVLDALDDMAVLDGYIQDQFLPFDPVGKRTEATVSGQGKSFKVSKGAPQAILGLCPVDEALASDVTARVDAMAAKGYRPLGVARDDGEGWRFLGLVPLYDPPREDAAETIQKAKEHGIDVKMVTGDHAAIAKEISRRLGLGTEIQPAEAIFSGDAATQTLDDATAERVEKADGFAQVFPEHKYGIVKALQQRGHISAMTGDGVNDAPALKQADVGVAVSGATDAARAAADLILTAPGLSVIVSAVEEARRIFERMNSYAIYRITETIRIMFFVVAAILVYNFYPVTAIMIILLALLNDVPIMTIASDSTYLSPTPVQWDMRRVLTVSSCLGLIGVVETFLLLILARTWLGLDQAQIQSFIFLKLAVAGHLTLFVARSSKPMLARPFPSSAMIWSAVATKLLATLVVAYGFFVTPISWKYIGLIWGYCIIWVFIEDWAKLGIYKHLNHSAGRHSRFLAKAKLKLHKAG